MSNLIKILPVNQSEATTWFVQGGFYSLDRSNHDLIVGFIGQGVSLRQPSGKVALSALTPIILEANYGNPQALPEIYLGVVATLFLSQLTGTPLKGELLPRTLSKPWKSPVVEADAKLWMTVYNALQRINALGLWDCQWPIVHPGIGLQHLAQEGMLISMVSKGSDGYSRGFTLIEDEQSINRSLRSKKNPFPENSFTHYFVEKCRLIMSKPDVYGDFEGVNWDVLLKARVEYINKWKKSGPHIISIATGKSARPQVAGRKKRRAHP